MDTTSSAKSAIAPQLLSVAEAGQMLRISRTKAYDLIVTKRVIPSIKIDGSRRIRAKDVEAYIDRLFESAQ